MFSFYSSIMSNGSADKASCSEFTRIQHKAFSRNSLYPPVGGCAFRQSEFGVSADPLTEIAKVKQRELRFCGPKAFLSTNV